MKIQAILLAFIIFFSIFLASPSREEMAAVKNDFWRDLSLANLGGRVKIETPFSCPALSFASSTSKAALVRYLDKDLNLFEKNSEERRPAASLTKLMTALVAMNRFDPEEPVVMSEKAIESEGIVGNFKTGESFNAGDLIKAMLVTSSNDAAAALVFSAGEREFIDAMQITASGLRMFDTAYIEPTGLSVLNQSTASDLAKLTKYIYENYPEILEISRQKHLDIIELKSGRLRRLINVNHFAGEPDFLGGKTGYTEEADRNLIALFRLKDKIFLTIVLGAKSAVEEIKTIRDLINSCL